jgi:hypothetical protein
LEGFPGIVSPDSDFVSLKEKYPGFRRYEAEAKPHVVCADGLVAMEHTLSAESTSTLWSLEEESDERTEGIVEQDFSFA